MTRVFSYLGSLWKGHEPCWVAYWVFGVFLTNLFSFIGERTVPEDPTIEVSSLRIGFAIAVAVFFLAYVVFVSVAIWRCAPNASHPVWTFLARALLLIGLALGVTVAFVGA